MKNRILLLEDELSMKNPKTFWYFCAVEMWEDMIFGNTANYAGPVAGASKCA
jgi:hypothetical protein